MSKEFQTLKNNIINLISNKIEITKETEYKNGGIYLLYVDHFNSDKIIPVYIGKTHNFQERHKEHLKELFSINRLSKKYYTSSIISKYYDGYYKSCKIFKYLVDNDCSFEDLHMIILEECDDEEKRTLLEYDYINKYLTSLFEFNQLNPASAYQEFCSNYNIELQAIPSGFHSNGILNIAEINGIHSQLETWISKFRGVSIRDLQEYLDWFVYIFTMKKRFRLNKIKTESYSNIILNNNYIKSNDIFTIQIPIDLNITYGEYQNQSLC